MGVGGHCCCCSKKYVNDEDTAVTFQESTFVNPQPVKQTVFEPTNNENNDKNPSEIDDDDDFNKGFDILKSNN